MDAVVNRVSINVGALELRSISTLDVAVVSLTVWALFKLIKATRRQGVKTTRLRGPPNESIVFGNGRVLDKSPDSAEIYEQWAEEYGAAYKVPSALGKSRIVLCDPKAISHYYPRETSIYILTPVSRNAIERLAGRGLLWSHGESHKRQRKSLTPGFSNTAIRRLTSVFFDSAYKAKTAWDAILESNPGGSAVIDVQNWMNHISIDTIGIAGFSHDFGSLEGKRSAVVDAFEELNSAKPSILSTFFFLLAPMFPWLIKLPNSRGMIVRKLNRAMGEISKVLLERSRQEIQGGASESDQDKSIIGLLIKSEDENSALHVTPEEVMAQMKLLLIAGYETTSISLTWALIELSYNQEAQRRLREELQQFSTNDPNWEQLNNGLPYLDGVVQETLRLHPPITESTRLAAEDDVIPLSVPVQTASGEVVDRLTIAKDTILTIPIRCVNRSVDFWGPDAKEFNPDRWIDDGKISGKAKDLQGHRHLLTFADGPRTCLGKGFALAEFKAVLSVLIRSFAFELRDGPDTKIERARGLLPRPRVAGEQGCRVPLLVRRVE
ncbi:hypothetical protein SERLA73DRAFT_191276 [Serpula lacrymans var. lacrymans S7.3]|uniref:Cytochrome P450 n=2 Tax=Serpula lacrymans var. lacrymans TaxID=341189 RepID=F8QH73_SERL3|nr:uncharacterized protein SERLADRAFT_459896 [Serpula lacrymans var. lacrymans S7.9]EGN92322.1 hypothetical protein SERLA73DRAFT_191276 [Serpula lacrymans var. lacrymans S7.3]EGO27077.1 hypothetical protein SERLADRAFT_459896 [Serpula lacrymans var. lacrymans S7.9]